MENFLCFKIAEIDMGGGGGLGWCQFWVEENDSGLKTHFFFKLNPFSGGKYPNSITRSLPLFGIRTCAPPGPGERLKGPVLIGLKECVSTGPTSKNIWAN